MGRYVIGFLLYIWQLPQNLVGLIYMLITKGEKKILEQRGATFYTSLTNGGGVSLGDYIFISPEVVNKDPVYYHEFGHCIHSGQNFGLTPEVGTSGYAGEHPYHKPGLIITSIEWLRK